MIINRSLYLRLAIGGIGGGLLVVSNPELRMFWQGIVLVALGCIALAIWAWGLGAQELPRREPPSRGRSRAGPTGAHIPDDIASAPTTAHLLTKMRRGRREASRAEETGGSDDTAGPTLSYIFAHQALPSIAFQSPTRFLGAMSESNPNREAILYDLWGQVRATFPDHLAAAQPPASFPIHPFVLFGKCGILIELPEPQQPGEAYFAAVVVRLPMAGEPRSVTPPPTWYFTLERTDEQLAALLPRTGNNRLVNAVRDDPKLLATLLGETKFRAAFLRGLTEELLPHLSRSWASDR
jgi:hypothetical protein